MHSCQETLGAGESGFGLRGARHSLEAGGAMSLIFNEIVTYYRNRDSIIPVRGQKPDIS